MTRLLVICLSVLICFLFSACGNKPIAPTAVNQSEPDKIQTRKLSIVTKLKENDHLPVTERIALYHQLRKEQPALYDFANETELTLYG